MKENDLVSRQPVHWPSILQFALSLAAAILLLGTAFLIVVIGFVEIVAGQLRLEESTPLFLIASSAFLGGMLTIPSAYFSLARLQGWRVTLPGCVGQALLPFRHPWVLALLVPGLLFLGDQVARNENLAWLFLPVINMVTVSIPILFFVYLGLRGLNVNSKQRRWGALAAGMLLSPLLGVILEIGVMLLYLIAGVIYLAADPERLDALNVLLVRLSAAGTSEEMLLRIIAPYLLQPAVIITGLSLVSLVVPLIEEAIKPIAVWLLAGKNLIPTEGFVLGILSGAGFALYENLVSLPTEEMWGTTVLARMGAALLHILTGGLTGWGLVVSWQRRRYLYLVVAYLAAVLLHSIWNTAAVAAGVWQLDIGGLFDEGFVGQIISYSPAVLAAVSILMVLILLAVNGRLRRNIQQ